MEEFLIRGGKVVTPDGVVESGPVDPGWSHRCVLESILKPLRRIGLMLQGEIVLPGGVDVHVHLPWPTGSFISSDDFNSGTRAAAFGGVTSLLDFVIPEGDEDLPDGYREETHPGGGQCLGGLRAAYQPARERSRITSSASRNWFRPVIRVTRFSWPMRVSGWMKVTCRRFSDGWVTAGGMLNVHAEDGILADQLTADSAGTGQDSIELLSRVAAGGGGDPRGTNAAGYPGADTDPACISTMYRPAGQPK